MMGVDGMTCSDEAERERLQEILTIRQFHLQAFFECITMSTSQTVLAFSLLDDYHLKPARVHPESRFVVTLLALILPCAGAGAVHSDMT
jgi:hypothetical protein